MKSMLKIVALGSLLLAHGAQADELKCGRFVRYVKKDDVRFIVRNVKTGERVILGGVNSKSWMKVIDSGPKSIVCWDWE